MIEGLQLIIPKRLSLLKNTLVFSLLVSVLLSTCLWAGERDFPLTPVIEGFVMSNLLNWVLFFALLLSWLAILVSRFDRFFLFLSLLISVLLIFADIQRLQPWYYLYSCMLFILLFYNGRVDNPNTYNAFFVVLQLILCSVYFFSGFNMLNPEFVNKSFTQIIAPIHTWLSDRQFAFFVRSGHLAPYLLMFTGISLLVKSIRFLGIALSLTMHTLLLVFLCPCFSNANYALWFANLVFPCIVLLLFSGQVSSRYFSPAFLLQKAVFYPVAILFFILPFFNRLNLWPDFLSSNYRSGNLETVKISLSEEAYTRLPLKFQTYCFRENFSYVIDYEAWSENELHADCYPDERVFRDLYKKIVDLSGNQPEEVNMDKLNRHRLLFKP